MDEAGDAQQKAGDAIQLANGDIAAAENDLTQVEDKEQRRLQVLSMNVIIYDGACVLQIASESSDALSKANETMNTVNELNGRLNTLKRRFLKNQLSASEINEEVDAVSKDANNTLTEVGITKTVLETVY